MDTHYSPQIRAERLIAAGRTVLAVSSLFGVWLDPTEPGKHARVAYSLLAAYVVYSALLALQAWRTRDPGGRERVVTHVIDLAFFSLFVYFTAGPASPFTTYFVFSMVCATLRWRWRSQTASPRPAFSRPPRAIRRWSWCGVAPASSAGADRRSATRCAPGPVPAHCSGCQCGRIRSRATCCSSASAE
jgi:hypothetical protein